MSDDNWKLYLGIAVFVITVICGGGFFVVNELQKGMAPAAPEAK